MMGRLWEIRENYEDRTRSKKSSSRMYQCGYEDGYNDAMEEMEESEESTSSYRKRRS